MTTSAQEHREVVVELLGDILMISTSIDRRLERLEAKLEVQAIRTHLVPTPEGPLAPPEAQKRDPGYTVRGAKIRAIRLRKGLRQEDLAEMTGLQTGTISRIETGYHNAQLATVSKIAKALGVDVDDIVDWHEEPED
jgi:DNA-binding XRE family transcriptional regulator